MEIIIIHKVPEKLNQSGSIQNKAGIWGLNPISSL